MLLNRGADGTQTDHQKRSPLDYALIKEHEFVVALFSCHNTSVGDFTKQQKYMHSLYCILYDIYVHRVRCIVSESIAHTGLETSHSSTTGFHGNKDCIEGSYLGLFTENNES